MRTSEERIEELHRRMNTVKQAKAARKYRLICAAACAAALVLSVLAALGVSRLPVRVISPVSGGVSASVFAGHTALGYIVTALIGLCLGVLATVVCFRLKRRKINEDADHGRKH